jgi:hypothetical protein
MITEEECGQESKILKLDTSFFRETRRLLNTVVMAKTETTKCTQVISASKTRGKSSTF